MSRFPSQQFPAQTVATTYEPHPLPANVQSAEAPLHRRTQSLTAEDALWVSGEVPANHSLQLTGHPPRGRLRQPGTMSVVRPGRRRWPAAELNR